MTVAHFEAQFSKVYRSEVIEIFREKYPDGTQEISTQEAWEAINWAAGEHLERIGQKPSVPVFSQVNSGRSGTCGGELEFE